MSAVDEIKHVVVLILENHSFDQMLGSLSAVYDGQQGRDSLEGINPTKSRSNRDDKGKDFFQEATEERHMTFDPHHEVPHVATQLANHNGGFVQDLVDAYPEKPPPDSERQNIMGYYRLNFLPSLHQLALNYRVCDQWYSSLPGPTWPNRFFALSGTSMGRVDMPGDGVSGADLPNFFLQTQDTIFDRLNEKQINWKVYFHDIPQSWVFKQQRAPHNAAQYFYIRRFYEDARGHPDNFPQFSLIEPDYFGFEQNDDHPPHDIMRAEKLIADVYNALRRNEALWRSTLLVVFYDEHGGFYDHVEPPAAPRPDDYVAMVEYKDGITREFKFDSYGLRVPAILVSPWVKAGVEHTQFDHTSVLRFLIDKWGLNELDSERVKKAKSIAIALTEKPERIDALPDITLSPGQLKPVDQDLEDAAVTDESDHQKALKKLAEFLPSALWEKTKEASTEVLAETVPKLYPLSVRFWESCAAFVDRVRGWCEHGLAFLYQTHGHEIVLSSPDKVDQRYTSERNRIVRFLATQKSRAIEGLSDRVLDPQDKRSAAEREHAARALTAIWGHRVQGNHLEHAKKWLMRSNIGK
jgi:phospholipase C